LLKTQKEESVKQISSLKDAIVEKEKQLVELHTELDKFHEGAYGIKDALKEVQLLKGRNMLSEKRIQEYVKNINDLENQVYNFLHRMRISLKKLYYCGQNLTWSLLIWIWRILKM
jgi:septal ring factor EnvC (AmiA/AmiB activator)